MSSRAQGDGPSCSWYNRGYPRGCSDREVKMDNDEDCKESTAKVKVKVDASSLKTDESSELLLRYQQLFPHLFVPATAAAATTTVPPHQSILYSENCVNFNRLFHCSFDETSSSSSNQDELSISNCYTKAKVEVKTEEGSEILLEIEIETEPQSQSVNLVNNICNVAESNEKKRKPVVSNEKDMHGSDEDQLNEQVDHVHDTTSDITGTKKGRIGQRKSNRLPQQSTSCKTQEAQIMRRITLTLKKDALTLTEEDKSLLDAFPTLVRIVRKRFDARLLTTQRLKEFEDATEILETKCNQLAEIITEAKYLVVYSGAGISTSANIPDFRGTTGLWTLLKSGQSVDSQSVNTQVLTSADPTTTHMALKHLYAERIVKHIVSQNCDGLHLRSGIPKMGLSEIHGNMYIEVCSKCGRDYVRTFDVAENTRRHEHRTGRRCYNCHNPLRDSIVHFGERGKLRWPINWAGAEYNAHRADVILCIGSSLKVLRRYPWLWCMDKPAVKRPKLVIVNLMWTPKDQFAALKIHGRCDDVMTRVMRKLNMVIPMYSRLSDPLFRIATPLHVTELRTRFSRELAFPENEVLPLKLVDINNYIQFDPIFRLQSAGNSSDYDEPDSSDHGKDKCAKTRSAVKKSIRKVSSASSKGKNRIIKKGSGNGWLGNLTPGVKMKKRKVK